ncbi:CVNH domain-containing protein [Collimonas humicola]|uniref:CVNH domain-containing protein n=1 Tax=Collimonas humicola TaxID=2825886 RepID=UPI001B8BE426|nr:CVNH domain-containing protein [Collimonas humicola]
MKIKSMLMVIACGAFAACAASPYNDGYTQYQPAAPGYYGNAPVVAFGGYGDSPSYGDRRDDRYGDRYGDRDDNRYGGDNWTPPGSYRDSCRDIVVRRGMLEATCGGDNGGRRTAIPLSSCRSGSFENINGNLQCMGGGGRDYGGSNRDLPPGSYLQSCSEIGIRGGVLEATCGGRDNSRIRSSISLRSCRSGSFSNINGYLQCDR